jgi:integrase
VQELTVDQVAEWSAAHERVLAPTTAVIALITLNLVCRYAMRRDWLATNPVARLELGEKPHWTPGRVGVLEGGDLAKVLDRSGSYRPLFEVLAYTGLRIGEALGLTWADVDFDRNVLRVHHQLSRYREHARLKTNAANREVLLAPAIIRLLREKWVGSPFKSGDDFVFTTRKGRGRDYRHVGDAFRLAVDRAGFRGARVLGAAHR